MAAAPHGAERSDASERTDPRLWQQRGERIAWRGHHLFARSEGLGEPLLLLHGFPTSSWDWKELWTGLLPGRRLIALDYLGFGFSDKPADGDYTVSAYADQAEAVLHHFGVAAGQPIHILAHDLGDTVAQELVARQVERRPGAHPVLSLGLLNGGIFPEVHRPRLVQRLLDSPLGFVLARLLNRRSFERSMRAIFGPNTPPSAAELAGFWLCVSEQAGTRNYHRLIRYMRERKRERSRWVTPLVEGAVPFALINGLADPVSGAHVVARLRELRPSATIFELPGIGHYPLTEAAAQVLASYEQFREGVRASSGG